MIKYPTLGLVSPLMALFCNTDSLTVHYPSSDRATYDKKQRFDTKYSFLNNFIKPQDSTKTKSIPFMSIARYSNNIVTTLDKAAHFSVASVLLNYSPFSITIKCFLVYVLFSFIHLCILFLFCSFLCLIPTHHCDLT